MQKKLIKEALLRGIDLTPLYALHNFGCLRLAARINELRNEGMQIETILKPDTSYATYTLLIPTNRRK